MELFRSEEMQLCQVGAAGRAMVHGPTRSPRDQEAAPWRQAGAACFVAQ